MVSDGAVGFHRGEYHRLRVGRFRVIYVVDEHVITVERVDWAVCPAELTEMGHALLAWKLPALPLISA